MLYIVKYATQYLNNTCHQFPIRRFARKTFLCVFNYNILFYGTYWHSWLWEGTFRMSFKFVILLNKRFYTARKLQGAVSSCQLPMQMKNTSWRKNPNLLQIVVPVTFPKQRENNLCENFVTNWSLVCVCQNSKRFDLIDKFNYTSRYLYDIFTIDNPALAEHIPDIYSRELGVGAFVNGLSQISSFFSFSWIKQILPTKKHLSWI